MTDKSSFILYADYKQYLDILTDEDCGKLFKAIFEYIASGTVPEFDGAIKVTFMLIRTQIDRDAAKWEDIRHKRSEAGKKGMESRYRQA